MPALLRHPWRVLVLYTAVAVIAGFPLRDNFLWTFGWSAAPLGAWSAGIVALGSARPLFLVRRYRAVLALLLLGLAAAGALAMVNAPVGSVMGRSMGGQIGEAVAIAPDNWDRFNITPIDYAAAGARVAVVVAAAIAVAMPRHSLRFYWASARTLVKGAAAGVAGLTAGGRGAGAWRKRRAEAKRLQAEDTRVYKEWEASAEKNGAGQTANGQSESQAQETGDPGVSTAVTEAPPWEDGGDASRSLSRAAGPVAEPAPATILATSGGAAGSKLSTAVIGRQASAYNWPLPPMGLLRKAPSGGITGDEIAKTSRLIEDTLAQYGIDVTVDQTFAGPTVTMYGLKPGWKGGGNEPVYGTRVRVDMILSREKDIALALASPNIRFEPVVPGESVVGIEVPNARPTPVTLRSVMETAEWKTFAAKAQVPVPLGLGSGGEPVFADLARMPHILIAGATGSGKSVCINAIITGLIMSRSPSEVRLVMIDPKRVELTPYSGIPHLYTPVAVESDRAVVVLKALVREMMGRFRILEQAGVKNIVSFNQKSAARMAYLVILVDELADLMLQAANEVERLLVRLAQLGRATGVHLVVATQRPSVDVITGLIKANFPSRISFAVMSQVDSRTVLDSTGGEKLLGRGDMLYLPVDNSKPSRVQGAFLSDLEIESVVEAWKKVKGPELPELDLEPEDDLLTVAGVEAAGDSLTDRAVALARTQKTLSTSLLQRRLRIGYPRAARLMDELEESGVVGPGEAGKPRQVLSF